MSKNTPWKQSEDRFSIYVLDAMGRIIADVREPIHERAFTVEERMEKHRQLARMIAAAPDLLEACKLAQVQLEKCGVTLGDLGAAIAKAEGSDSEDNGGMSTPFPQSGRIVP